MRQLLLCLALGMLALSPLKTAQAYSLPKPKLIAVYFYADWCPNCKILSSIVTAARAQGELDSKDILFVTLNLTDKSTIHQSILLAQALGIAPFMQAQGSATGYVAVLDAGSKKELQRFDRTSTADAMAAAITKRLAP